MNTWRRASEFDIVLLLYYWDKAFNLDNWRNIYFCSWFQHFQFLVICSMDALPRERQNMYQCVKYIWKPDHSPHAEMSKTADWTFPQEHTLNYQFLPHIPDLLNFPEHLKIPAQTKEYGLTLDYLGSTSILKT